MNCENMNRHRQFNAADGATSRTKLVGGGSGTAHLPGVPPARGTVPHVRVGFVLDHGHRRRPGFTLTELLVMIVIVAVLATLAFMVGRRAIDSARSASGIANLRQIGSLHQTFIAETGRLPFMIATAQGGGPTPNYYQAILCTASDLPISTQTGPDGRKHALLPDCFYDPVLTGKRQHPWGVFGVNRAILPPVNHGQFSAQGLAAGRPVASLANPDKKVIVCSARGSESNPVWHGSWTFDGQQFVQAGPTASPQQPDPRHGGRSAALFGDGHVQLLDTDSMDRTARERYFLPDP